jgi:hypothetical protein
MKCLEGGKICNDCALQGESVYIPGFLRFDTICLAIYFVD